jgi:hypothetical protein
MDSTPAAMAEGTLRRSQTRRRRGGTINIPEASGMAQL